MRNDKVNFLKQRPDLAKFMDDVAIKKMEKKDLKLLNLNNEEDNQKKKEVNNDKSNKD